MMIRVNQMMQSSRLWMTGFGTETSMIFHEGLELPHFAAFIRMLGGCCGSDDRHLKRLAETLG